jgi:FAD binding domain/Berberine and berberine like
VPGDDAYDNARKVWNGMIDKYPALVARCTNSSDVVRAIEFARNQNLEVAVRGGGHSFAGNGTCDGGMVIDLSRMKRVQINPAKRTAWAQAGLTLGEFIRETQKFGLATPVGTASETGLSGLTLGGGTGWLMGKYGLTIDNLLAVVIVTADGRVLKASASEHPDLFWAIRGGSGNFGVVTDFEFQLHPLGSLLAGMIVHPLSEAGDILHLYREFTRRVPDELSMGVALASTPDGLPMVAFGVCYCGDIGEGQQLIEPLKHYGSPLVDFVRPMSYLELITMLDTNVPRGRHYFSKTHSLKVLTDDVFQAIIDAHATRPSPWTQIVLQHVHGATSRVDPAATAFALRDEYHFLQIMASWSEDEASEAETRIQWVRDLARAAEPYALSGTYINFLGSEEDESTAVWASYGSNYERLVQVKNTYDPTNFFHFNHNIKPAEVKPDR